MKKIKKELLKEQEETRKELSEIARKDPDVEDDWDAKYPEGQIEGSEDAAEDSAKLREEYEVRREVEHTLELKLKRIKNALKRIEQGSYGTCQNCDKEINEERLKGLPETPFCIDCAQ